MSNKKDTVYLLHIVESIDKINEFTKNMGYDEFLNNDLVQSAVIRKLEIIGEASNNVSEELKNKYPEVPWQIMKDMRNFLIHKYFGVDPEVVWDTIKNDILKVHGDIENILNNEKF